MVTKRSTPPSCDGLDGGGDDDDDGGAVVVTQWRQPRSSARSNP